MRQTLVLLLATGLASGCTIEPPFERTNPFDPNSSLELSLVGPDSVHALGARVDLTLRAEPALPPFPIYIRWVAHDLAWRPPGVVGGDPTMIQVASLIEDGSFTIIRTSARYEEITFAAALDEVVIARKIWVGQRATELDLSCATWALPYDPCDDQPIAQGATVNLYTRMHDANGSPVSREVQFAIMRATVTSRDPSVVTPLPLTADASGIVRVRAAGPGATWVVVRIDAATDSIRVAVAP